jgi:lysophospholipase L1-like esterase
MAIERAAFTALVDDSGGGIDGSIVNKALIASVLLNPIDAALATTSVYAVAPWVLMLGDSKTATVGWQTPLVDALTARTGRTHTGINRGVAGATVASTAGNLATVLNLTGLPAGVPMVVINLGVNDATSMPTEAAFKANYLILVDAIRAIWPSAPIWVAHPWKRSFLTDCTTLATWIEYVRTQRAGVYLGHDEKVWLQSNDDGAALTTDGIHYSALGYTAIAAQWVAHLRRAVAGAGSVGSDVVPQVTTLTGAQNDFALSPGCTLLRCNNATLLTLNGFAAGFDGQQVRIAAVGAGQVDIANQNTGSVPVNRVINGVTGSVSLSTNGSCVIAYDAATFRWRLISHDQGAWITPTFAAGNFTGSGTMGWTVASGNVATLAYLLEARQRKLTVSWEIGGTTVVAPLSNFLQFAIPGGFVAAKLMRTPAVLSDNGTPSNGYATVDAAGVIVKLAKTDGSNYAAAAATTAQRGSFAFEVT